MVAHFSMRTYGVNQSLLYKNHGKSLEVSGREANKFFPVSITISNAYITPYKVDLPDYMLDSKCIIYIYIYMYIYIYIYIYIL